MLDDFISSDKDLVDPRPFKDLMMEKIEDDTFFTNSMKVQFDMDYKALIPTIKLSITQDMADDIKSLIINHRIDLGDE